MKSRSILHAVGRLDVGGIEKYLLDFIPAAQALGVQSNVVTLFERERGSLADEFEKLGGKVYPAHALRKRGALLKSLLEALQESKADLIHSHLGEMSGDVARIFRNESVPVFVQAHDKGELTQSYLEPYRMLSRSWTLKYASGLAAVSDEAGRRLAGKSGRAYSVIPVGLNLSKWKRNERARGELRKEFGVGEAGRLILHVGRFHRVKNHPFLIRTAAELCKRNVDYKMLLVGCGANLEETKALAQKLGVAERVLFLGERNDVAELMSAADVLLLPSLSEGTPRVLLEAAAMGLRFVATSHADLSQLFSPSCCLAPADPAEWADRCLDAKFIEPIIDLSIERALQQTFDWYNSASVVH